MNNKIANINTTKFLLDKYNLMAKRSLGQNFIVDANIIERLITHANIDDKTAVIEIGPGLGALTQGLLDKAKKVVSIEIDQNMVEILNDQFKEKDNFELIHADILQFDLFSLLKDLSKDCDKVMIIANLPYYITSEILLKIFRVRGMFDSVMLMVQREFAQRLTADKSTKDYRTLTVLAKSFYQSRIIMKISKHVFYPRPKVDSAIILMRSIDNDIADLDAFIEFVEMCFVQKRQTIFNNLRKQIDQDFVLKILEASSIDKEMRAADLDVVDFKNMFEVYYEV